MPGTDGVTKLPQMCANCRDSVALDTSDGTLVGSDGEVTCPESSRPHGPAVDDEDDDSVGTPTPTPASFLDGVSTSLPALVCLFWLAASGLLPWSFAVAFVAAVAWCA